MKKLIDYLNDSCYNYEVLHNDNKAVIVVSIDNETKNSSLKYSYNNIKELRKASHLTQREFADYFNIPFRTAQD